MLKNLFSAARRNAARRLFVESLENRRLLAGVVEGCDFLDLNEDGSLTPRDALEWVNRYNALGARKVSIFENPEDFVHDVDRSGAITPADLLKLINAGNHNDLWGKPYDFEWCKPNEAPAARDDYASVFSGGSISFDIHANDTDRDGFLDLSRTEFGYFSADPPIDWIAWSYSHNDGMFEFHADSDYVGTVTLPYTVYDNRGASDSANIVINVMPVAQEARLAVQEQATGTSDIAVSGQRDINFVRFEVSAANRDVLLTEVVIWNGGNTSPAVLGQNFTIWVDANLDGEVETILEQGVAHNMGGVVFDDLANGAGFEILAGQSVVFEVHGDVVRNLPPNPQGKTLQLSVHSVTAETLDDGAPLGFDQIEYGYTPQKVWSFVKTGNLIIREGLPPSTSYILCGGGFSAPIMRMGMRGQYEPIFVQRLEFAAAGMFESVTALGLFFPGDTAPFAIAHRIDVTTFSSDLSPGAFVVPEDAEVEVIVRAWAEPEALGGESGENFFVHHLGTVGTDQDGRVWGIQAVGQYSSNVLQHDNGNGNTMEGEVLAEDVRSPDLVTTLALPVAVTNKMPIRALPSGPDQEVFRMEVTAAPNVNRRDVEMRNLWFVVNVANVELETDGFALYNTANPAVKLRPAGVTLLDWTPLIDATVDQPALLYFENVQAHIDGAIAPGGSEMFSLNVSVADSQVDPSKPSALQVKFDLVDSVFSDQTEDFWGFGLGKAEEWGLVLTN